jgi:hypothetical protein
MSYKYGAVFQLPRKPELDNLNKINDDQYPTQLSLRPRRLRNFVLYQTWLRNSTDHAA